MGLIVVGILCYAIHMTYSMGLRLVGWVAVVAFSATYVTMGGGTEEVDFNVSPAQITADAFPCTPTAEGDLPSTVVVLPEGETEPVQSAELVGPALEYIFENGPYIGVVMEFCA